MASRLQTVDRDALFMALLSCPERENSRSALLLVELSNLKIINRRYGYDTGDLVLKCVSERIAEALDMCDTLVRISGNQFAALVPGIANTAFAIMIASRVKARLAKVMTLDDVTGTEIMPVIHAGFTLFESLGSRSEAAMLFNEAERSLDLDCSGIAIHEHQEYSARTPSDTFDLIDEYLSALQANEFELFYQPKLNLETGLVDRVEALMRWRIPGVGMISPLKMLEFAESSDTLFALSKWVTFAAVRQTRDWLDQGLELKVSINLPADLIDHEETIAMVANALAIWGVPGEALVVEITESAVMADKNSGLNNLLHLREMGVDISIDDFGTGFSSLSYFKDIPADELKIDQSFVLNMKDEPQDRNIVELILRIAHLFDLSVVAEGIEDQETLDLLAELGCNYAQGYHIAKPMPAEALLEWFDSLEVG